MLVTQVFDKPSPTMSNQLMESLEECIWHPYGADSYFSDSPTSIKLLLSAVTPAELHQAIASSQNAEKHDFCSGS